MFLFRTRPFRNEGAFDIYLCFDSIAISDFVVVILLVTKDLFCTWMFVILYEFCFGLGKIVYLSVIIFVLFFFIVTEKKNIINN